MPHDTSIWSFVLDAGWVVKCVLLLLLCASVSAWALIFQRYTTFRAARSASQQFEAQFWSGTELKTLWNDLQKSDAADLSGLAAIFNAGMQRFHTLFTQCREPEAILEGVERAMQISINNQLKPLEKHLSFLATVGSTSPYVGLFGTVWGIMTSFSALGTVQQATIAMVAPGISEALIATAVGLFAAIPAVIAYNRFQHGLTQIEQQYETFQQELLNVFHKRVYANE